ncbi:DUF2059 domain-containing protein [Aurantiacibacter aquimixticola]|uniref:DUF2059 domain-containing protein n=1 Tax=Aurantiacibacter aquimixticola TaxID=1958945 RepID=A0A419RV36_9SPHN|nr:DUF2059 domain-containing protein [Aurantiacibacter aquimixticola]RJY09653.1 DUF2059 domain-containing protein [Aurantiacibacter aquimixticola]
MKIVFAPLAAFGLAVSQPVMAQDAQTVSEDDMAVVGEMMAELFQSEPLTAEQQARLPAAQQVVGAMIPEGSYAEMMREVMQNTMAPMLGLIGSPEVILMSRIDVDEQVFNAMSENERRELMTMLDPAYEERGSVMMDALMGSMYGMFDVIEEPMREGLSKAYAARFTADQLADIAVFFATPTGQVYAPESMALFADPRVMSASMEAMPAMLGSFANMEADIAAAMASLPAERGVDDLTASERARAARLLGVKPAQLGDVILPPTGI